jgi:hypothetical protein
MRPGGAAVRHGALEALGRRNNSPIWQQIHNLVLPKIDEPEFGLKRWSLMGSRDEVKRHPTQDWNDSALDFTLC